MVLGTDVQSLAVPLVEDNAGDVELARRANSEKRWTLSVTGPGL